MTVFRWGSSGGGLSFGTSSEYVQLQQTLFPINGSNKGLFIAPALRQTLFQEAAGTTAADDPAEPVALALDRSGNGNSPQTADSTARPLLRRSVKGGRTNLASQTEDFNNATNWLLTGVAAVSGPPWLIREANTTTQHGIVYASAARPSISAGAHTAWFDISLTDVLQRRVLLANNGTSGTSIALVDLETETTIAESGTTARGVIALGDGVFRIWMTWTATPGTSGPSVYLTPKAHATATAPTYLGDVNERITLHRMALQAGTEILSYQRVRNNSDITESGKTELWQLAHDQVNDLLAATLPDLGTNATLAYTTQDGAVISTGLTIGAGSYNLPTPLFLGPVIIRETPFSAAELSAVTAYLLRHSEGSTVF